MRKLILSMFIALNFSSLAATPSQIMIIRHGEKNSSGYLSEKGLERAGALAPYFAESEFLNEFGPPVAIFAARPTKNEKNQRCIQTVGPTALMLKLPIHSGYAKSQVIELADFILNNPDYDGKNVLICWNSDSIEDLALALGVNSPGPFPDVYDILWVIDYDADVTLTSFNQQLLFGDTP